MRTTKFYIIPTILVAAAVYTEGYRVNDLSNGKQNYTDQGFTAFATEEPTAELPEYRYDVVQLTVPRNIKMNDINDYREIVLPAYSNTNIKLRNMSRYGKDVGFALIQMNAYEYNVTLSYTNTIVDGRHLNGLNLGLILYDDGSLYAINTDPHVDVMVSLVLMLYNKTAPIPGGCNMEFPVDTSPVLNLTLKDTTIEVDTPPASVAKQFAKPDGRCGRVKLNYESYYLSMPSYDFSQRTYFSYIRKLISYTSAKASGRLHNLASTSPSIKRVYDRQVGRGMVFVTVAIDPINRGFAAYVPVHSYACQPFLNVDGCYEFNVPSRVIGFILTVIMAAEIVMGFCPIFVKAFICGGVVGVVGTIKMLTYFNYVLDKQELISALIVGAAVFAIVFLILSILCPIAAIIGCNFLVGYMLCSVIFHGIYGLFTHWWLGIVFVICTFFVGLLFGSIPMFLYANGFLFGGAVLFYGVNVVFDARLHYWLRHAYHGVFQEHFGSVLSDSTLDTNEIMAVVSFVIILSICIYLRIRCKLCENRSVRSRVQLPCSDRGSRTSVAFLADDSFAYENASNHATITRWTSGDDDVFESPESNSRFFDRLRGSMR